VSEPARKHEDDTLYFRPPTPAEQRWEQHISMRKRENNVLLLKSAGWLVFALGCAAGGLFLFFEVGRVNHWW
jgi:hypothetical protein